MSIDLDWGKLDSSLAAHLIDVLNRQLSSTPRPSFIGPIEVNSLDFGSLAPDVELVDLRDIYRDFLDDYNDDEENENGDNEQEQDRFSERDSAKVAEDRLHYHDVGDDDGFEWVSRRAAAAGTRSDDGGLAYHHLPPHVRYGRTPTPLTPASTPPILHAPRPTRMSTAAILEDPSQPLQPQFRSPSPSTPFSLPFQVRHHLPNDPPLPHTPDSPGIPSSSEEPPLPNLAPAAHLQPQNDPLNNPPPPTADPNPSLQVHLHINWHSNLRITLTTSLLINYPSPRFMALPIKLSVTGLVFTGELAVAYDGQRNRVHLCILDDLDPYGFAAGSSNSDRFRRERDFATTIGDGGTPPELDDDILLHSAASLPYRNAKPLPIGQRLLPSIYIESEIGQADKHVLKNVTRVERFIQDVIRKTVEEELVFPNFHTLLMGDS